MLRRLWNNVRYAARRLAQRPGFTLVAILSLALGIGANSAIFSLVNAVLLRRAPLQKPEELVEIYLSPPSSSTTRSPTRTTGTSWRERPPLPMLKEISWADVKDYLTRESAALL